MIIEPKVKSSILLTAHPEGCKQLVKEQIEYVKNNKKYTGAKKALIIGSSSGYGLATRISLAFGGSKTETIGVAYESGPKGKRTGTAGWFNTLAFNEEAKKEGIKYKNFMGDAFSNEMKEDVIKFIKEEFGKVDLVIYSLASGKRQDPVDGVMYTSALRSTTGGVTGPTVDLESDTIFTQTMENATKEEEEATVKVMGGEDWNLWIRALAEADCLTEGAKTFAYSYIGPKLTYGIYKDGTIGLAKRHLEKTADDLDAYLKEKINDIGIYKDELKKQDEQFDLEVSKQQLMDVLNKLFSDIESGIKGKIDDSKISENRVNELKDGFYNEYENSSDNIKNTLSIMDGNIFKQEDYNENN